MCKFPVQFIYINEKAAFRQGNNTTVPTPPLLVTYFTISLRRKNRVKIYKMLMELFMQTT